MCLFPDVVKWKRSIGDNKEERANALSSFVAHRQFCAVVLIYPTAHGKQPIMEILPQGVGGVSTHALRTEGNRANSLFPRSRTDFYPRPPHRGRHQATIELGDKLQFLPTPSARRHDRPRNTPAFLPTPSTWMATQSRKGTGQNPLSIHALHTEGDCIPAEIPLVDWDFYPRPPRGGRQSAINRCRLMPRFLSTPSRGG